MKKIVSLILALTMLCGAAFALASCGKKTTIGVQTGTTGEFYVKGNADMELPGFSNITCNAYNNGGLAVKALIDGQIDYVIIDNEPAKQLLAANPNDIKIIDIALTTEQYAYGVDKDQPQLLDSVNTIIAAMKVSGALDALFAKYEALQYDEDGNVIGGDELIPSFASAEKSTTNPAGQLVVATNAAFAPYEYKKGNEFAGIDIEIAAYIAEALNLELVIEDMDFDSVVTSVGKNNVDIAMAGLSVTATRKQSVNFSDPYYEGAYQVIIVKADNTEFDSCTTKAQIEEILKNK